MPSTLQTVQTVGQVLGALVDPAGFIIGQTLGLVLKEGIIDPIVEKRIKEAQAKAYASLERYVTENDRRIRREAPCAGPVILGQLDTAIRREHAIKVKVPGYGSVDMPYLAESILQKIAAADLAGTFGVWDAGKDTISYRKQYGFNVFLPTEGLA